MASAVVLDHVALALEHQRDVLPLYVGELGGAFAGYGEGPGFSPMQVRFSNGAKIELLRPFYVEHNDFLRRFIDQRGAGPHHFTFKVPDIVAAIDELDAAGYPVINVDLSYPDWKEGFLHPKVAHGIVVQIAQTPSKEMPGDPPPWFEPAADDVAGRAALVRAEHRVASLDAALGLFRDVLGGRVVGNVNADDVPDGATAGIDLAWEGAGRLRIYEPVDPSVLGGEGGRFGRLVFASSHLTEIVTIAADQNHGTEVLIIPA